MYDLDIVEEETILDWGKKVSKKHATKEMSALIHEKAQPILKWLQEAEEDSESSDEEGVEVRLYESICSLFFKSFMGNS